MEPNLLAFKYKRWYHQLVRGNRPNLFLRHLNNESLDLKDALTIVSKNVFWITSISSQVNS